MHDYDLSDLTIEEMLYLKQELNKAYQKLVDSHNDWVLMCKALREEMITRSEYLKYAEEEARSARETEYNALYEALNNLH